ncbi:MAG: anthranilate synthase component I [Pelagibacteraceae bacterium]|nr:anthranilate synthase component I [Pelagibacteraceae bacterium]
MEYLSFDDFSKIYQNKKSQILYKKIISDLETPISALLKLSPNQEYSFLLESVSGGEKRGRYSLFGIKPDIIWSCLNNKVTLSGENKDFIKNFPKHKNPLESLRDLLKKSLIKKEESLPPCPVLVGYMGYPMIKYMENIKLQNADDILIPESIFIRPKIVVVFDNVYDTLTIMAPVHFSDNVKAKIAYDDVSKNINNVLSLLNSKLQNIKQKKYNVANIIPKSNFTKKDYLGVIEKAKKYIIEGDIFQIVPSQRFVMDYKLPTINLYRSLRRLNPSPFLVNLNFKNIGLVASSPEILVRLRNNKITIRPIAGTRKRGLDKAEDIKLSKDLLSDKKEIAEHLMLLDLARNDVGRVSKIGTVNVTERMSVEYYSHVMHIVSNVEGEVNSNFDSIDAIIAGFPAGTVSGAPKIRAMEIIEELETQNRSFYGGAIGYFDSNGDMDTCITLRTGLIKDNKLFVQAGGGVVYDSVPEKEFQETLNKAEAIIKAAKKSYEDI